MQRKISNDISLGLGKVVSSFAGIGASSAIDSFKFFKCHRKSTKNKKIDRNRSI